MAEAAPTKPKKNDAFVALDGSVGFGVGSTGLDIL